MNRAVLLKKAAAMLRAARPQDYRWNYSCSCNFAFVVAAAVDGGSRPVADTLRSLGARNGVIWSQNLDHPVCSYLKRKFSLSDADIVSIEYLTDKRVLAALKRSGVSIAPLFNRNKRFVAAYLDQMAKTRTTAPKRTTALPSTEEVIA